MLSNDRRLHVHHRAFCLLLIRPGHRSPCRSERLYSSNFLASRSQPSTHVPTAYFQRKEEKLPRMMDSAVSLRLSKRDCAPVLKPKGKRENSFVRSLADRCNNIQNPVREMKNVPPSVKYGSAKLGSPRWSLGFPAGYTLHVSEFRVCEREEVAKHLIARRKGSRSDQKKVKILFKLRVRFIWKRRFQLRSRLLAKCRLSLR